MAYVARTNGIGYISNLVVHLMPLICEQQLERHTCILDH